MMRVFPIRTMEAIVDTIAIWTLMLLMTVPCLTHELLRARRVPIGAVSAQRR
jgi:hypothetical protein